MAEKCAKCGAFSAPEATFCFICGAFYDTKNAGKDQWKVILAFILSLMSFVLFCGPFTAIPALLIIRSHQFGPHKALARATYWLSLSVCALWAITFGLYLLLLASGRSWS